MFKIQFQTFKLPGVLKYTYIAPFKNVEQLMSKTLLLFICNDTK